MPRTDMIGGPRAPLPDETLSMKFLQNAELAIGPERAAVAADAWRYASRHDDVAALLESIA